MNPEYKSVHETAMRMFHRAKDKIDDQNTGSRLLEDIRDIAERLESGKPPRSVEDQIKRVEQALRGLDSQSTKIMDDRDADELVDMCMDLRSDVRELPNY